MDEKELKGYRAFIQIGIPEDYDPKKLIRTYYGTVNSVMSALTTSLTEIAIANNISLEDLIKVSNDFFTNGYKSANIDKDS